MGWEHTVAIPSVSHRDDKATHYSGKQVRRPPQDLGVHSPAGGHLTSSSQLFSQLSHILGESTPLRINKAVRQNPGFLS